jgi:hypothetical protein
MKDSFTVSAVLLHDATKTQSDMTTPEGGSLRRILPNGDLHAEGLLQVLELPSTCGGNRTGQEEKVHCNKVPKMAC